MRKLCLDVSRVFIHDERTGIQRVVRALFNVLCLNPPEGIDIIPVYGDVKRGKYFVAHNFSCLENNDLAHMSAWEEVHMTKGDVYACIDSYYDIVHFKKYFDQLHNSGVYLVGVCHDLLPIELDESFFWQGARESVERQIETMSNFDLILGNSKTTAMAVEKYFKERSIRNRARISWFHLGNNVEKSMPTRGLPENYKAILSELSNSLTFLIVGTVEPRKGHMQILKAFEYLWKSNKTKAKLVIVGKDGWNVDQLRDEIDNSEFLGENLIRLKSVSDEYLRLIYKASTCVIVGSFGEGYGLPLVEAAYYDKYVIARDIPIFREIAKDGVYYFSSLDPLGLAMELLSWIDLWQKKTLPKNTKNIGISWEESSKQFLNEIF